MLSASRSSEHLWRTTFVAFCLTLALTANSAAQDPPKSPTAPAAQEAGTSTDLFIMLGSDFDRPGNLPKANYNIGIGHTFGFLKKDPLGDELTFSYTYEDAGSGFWHSQYGSDTESFGVMKNFGLPGTRRVTGYTWIQVGITSLTGGGAVENHFYDGEALGAVVHFTSHHSIWIVVPNPGGDSVAGTCDCHRKPRDIGVCQVAGDQFAHVVQLRFRGRVPLDVFSG